MLIIGLFLLAAGFGALGILSAKYMDNYVGNGLGEKNKKDWGIEDKKK